MECICKSNVACVSMTTNVQDGWLAVQHTQALDAFMTSKIFHRLQQTLLSVSTTDVC